MSDKIKKIQKGGRPKKQDCDKKDNVISFRVDELTSNVIQQKLQEARLSMSEFIRRALQNSKITQADYDELIGQIDYFSAEQLINLIVVEAKVVVPMPIKLWDKIKKLYRFATDINRLVKRGNASLKGKPEIDYSAELNNIKEEFNKLKEQILKEYEEGQQ